MSARRHGIVLAGGSGARGPYYFTAAGSTTRSDLAEKAAQ
jgi:hypothetical protein